VRQVFYGQIWIRWTIVRTEVYEVALGVHPNKDIGVLER
jgi:hypothetical protein